MKNIVELRGISKTYAQTIKAVDDLSLDIATGEFITLLGPSGCGKTTTLRMIAGFEYPDKGSILLEGNDVTELPPYRRLVNTVFQDYALFPHMTVAQNVSYGLRVSGIGKAEADERVSKLLDMVGLLEKADTMPGQLSGGQRQRIALARGLSLEPRVLLLDEPMSALDVKLREQMQVELKHLHEKLGITFILVTHDQQEALVMSDRIVVMNEGRIMQIGTPTGLYDHPATPYVANFIGTSNMIDAVVEEFDATMASVSFAGNRLRVKLNGQKIRTGQKVQVSVRPEKAYLDYDDGTQGDTSAHNNFTARVTERFFYGNTLRLELDVEGEPPFLVDMPLSLALHNTQAPEQGSIVKVGVNPENINLFTGED